MYTSQFIKPILLKKSCTFNISTKKQHPNQPLKHNLLQKIPQIYHFFSLFFEFHAEFRYLFTQICYFPIEFEDCWFQLTFLSVIYNSWAHKFSKGEPAGPSSPAPASSVALYCIYPISFIIFANNFVMLHFCDVLTVFS